MLTVLPRLFGPGPAASALKSSLFRGLPPFIPTVLPRPPRLPTVNRVWIGVVAFVAVVSLVARAVPSVGKAFLGMRGFLIRWVAIL